MQSLKLRPLPDLKQVSGQHPLCESACCWLTTLDQIAMGKMDTEEAGSIYFFCDANRPVGCERGREQTSQNALNMVIVAALQMNAVLQILPKMIDVKK
jgi:hypothetical protein